MIEVKFYDTIKELQFKPSTFEQFCEEIQTMFDVDNPDKFTYEYLTNDDKYYPLNLYNYSDFYMNDDIKKVFGYAQPDEAFTYNPEKKEDINKIIIIKQDEEEEENPNFYEENNDENLDKKDIINPDLVKQKIVNEFKEKIKKMKMPNKEKEEKDKKEEKEKKEKKEENIISNNDEEISQIIINNEKEVNGNNNIDNQLNDIINKNFEKLKNDLINESSAQLSQIVMESKIKNEESDDDIETPLSVEIHTGFVCDGCGKTIYGIRYKCVICNDFDYCEKCEKENGYVHDHPFYKLRFKIN